MSAHPHGRPAPVPRRTARWVFALVLGPALVATVLGGLALWPADGHPTIPVAPGGITTLVAVVTDTTRTDGSAPAVRAHAGTGDITVQVPPEYLPELHAGDRVRVVEVPHVAPGTSPYVFQDFERGPPMALLAALFLVLVVAVARWRGVASLLGLAIALVVVWTFTLPALLVGRSAVAVGLVSASAIMFAVLYLAHGFTLRTSTALLGTLAGLVATAAIAAWASGAAHLTGLSDEYALDLMSYAPAIRLRSVLLAGTLLAGLGVLNDVTVTQASAVWELHAAQPSAPWRRLVAQGMRIGRDHIASTIYTIAFAYIGAALPLVLLVEMSTDVPLLQAVTSGELAEEVARTLVGSIGLVLAIPLTTVIAALVVTSGRAGAVGAPAAVGAVMADPGTPSDPAAVGAMASDPAPGPARSTPSDPATASDSGTAPNPAAVGAEVTTGADVTPHEPHVSHPSRERRDPTIA